jgi:hypothetical protein
MKGKALNLIHPNLSSTQCAVHPRLSSCGRRFLPTEGPMHFAGYLAKINLER